MPSLGKRTRSEIQDLPPLMPIPDHESKISQYELSREERIRENRERLGKLGIYDIALSLKLESTPPSRRTPSNRKSPISCNPSGPSRRSSRLQNVAPITFSEVGEKKTRVVIREGSGPEVYTEEHESRSNKSGDEVVKKKRAAGFCQISSLSPQLQEFTGAPEMARTQVNKLVWAYIKEKNLQDPENGQNINCDEPLRALFGVNSIHMFQMNKVLAKHIWPLGSDGVIQVKSTPKKKQKKKKREDDDSDEPKGKEKRQKGGSGKGFLAPLQLSDALAKFLGESELSRSEVIKRMWGYIKGNNLQDPSDKRQIICDEKLKELFGVDSFNGFTVSKLLVPHFIKT